jgi:hypothetical protein
MKFFYQISFLAIFALSAATAFANTTVCSSSDSKLSYNQFSPNGGPERPSTENLTLDGQTLINVSFPGGAAVRIADISFNDDPVWSQVTTTGNNQIRLLLRKVTVSQVTNGLSAALFDDFVFCRSNVYVGPPVP